MNTNLEKAKAKVEEIIDAIADEDDEFDVLSLSRLIDKMRILAWEARKLLDKIK